MDVATAVEALKKAASKTKKESVRQSIDHLGSVVSLLKLSSSSQVLTTLRDIFLKDVSFAALYSQWPLPMLQFCAAVLRAILHDKIEATQDHSIQYWWGNVLKAVVFNVQDFLEQNTSASSKSHVATALYTTLIGLSYPKDSQLAEWQSPHLVFNVNLLLQETVTDHPDNSSQLRNDKILGAKRIGYMLSKSRDFFIIESLLALLGTLLPPRKSGAKRAAFIDEAFPTKLFPRSAQIKSLIGAHGDTDWDPVGTQIINECLSKTDITFPQPFYIRGFRTSTDPPNIVDPLYIDSKFLFANIEEDGVIDSYQVAFKSIERISMTGAIASDVSVQLQLCAEPTVGAGEQATAVGAQETPRKQPYTIAFQLKGADRARFAEALRARGLGKLISDNVDRKVSKLAEGLSLEYPSKIGGDGNGSESANKPPPTQQEKIAKVEQLWQSNEDESGSGSAGPTSPLVASSTKALLAAGAMRSPSESQSHHQSSEHEVIFGDALSDMSDDETTPPVSKKKPEKAGARKSVRVVLDSDDEEKERASKGPAKTRRAAVEDEGVDMAVDEREPEELSSSPAESDAMDEDFEPTQGDPPKGKGKKAPEAPPARVTRGAAKQATRGTGKAETSGAKRVSVSARRVEAKPKPGTKVKGEAPVSLSEDEVEIGSDLEAEPAPSSKKASTRERQQADKKRQGNAARTAVKTTSKAAAAESKTRQKRGRPAEDQPELASRDEPEVDSRPTKRAREAGTTDDLLPDGGNDRDHDSEAPAMERRVSAAVFGTTNLPVPPAKKRYGKKALGRTSSPAPPDINEIDFDEPPVAVSKQANIKTKMKQEPPPAGEQKSRVAGMKGKGGVERSEPVTKGKGAKAAAEKAKTRNRKPIEEDVEMTSDSEVKAPLRSGRTTRANAAEAPVPQLVEVAKPKPKPKQRAKPAKPKRAPWEDMHLRKSDDVAPEEPQVETDSLFAEFLVPGVMASSDLPLNPQDDVAMIDMTEDIALPPTKAKKVQPEADASIHAPLQDHLDFFDAFADPRDSTSAPPAVSTSTPPAALPSARPPLPSVFPPFSASPLPSVSNSPLSVHRSAIRPAESAHSIPPTEFKPAFATAKVNVTTPTRSAHPAPAAKLEAAPAPVLPMTKFTTEPPLRAASPAPARLSKLPTPLKQRTPPRLSPVLRKTAPTPPPPSLPGHQHYRASPPQRKFTVKTDSPPPERTHQTVAFAPPPSPVPQRGTALHSSKWEANNRGRSLHTTSRSERNKEKDERGHDYKRSRSPMQGIIEILNEIQEVVVEKISGRFDHVRQEVRVGRDNILRGAAESLQGMCKESEVHFNTLFDLQEEYATYHRKVILGLDDMQKSAEVMHNALGQVIQHHDRRSLSKKLPTTLFSLPAIVRNPVLSL